MRWHAPESWPLLREALVRMGRRDLIGDGPGCLVPATDAPAAAHAREPIARGKRFQTQHTGLANAASPRRAGGSQPAARPGDPRGGRKRPPARGR